MGGIYKVYAIEMASGGMIHIPSSITTGSGTEVILILYNNNNNFITSTISECAVSVLLIGGIYEVAN
jgi:hypothetical protein